MSNQTKKTELKILQIESATHTEVKALAAKAGMSMPQVATQLINIALAMNPDLENDE